MVRSISRFHAVVNRLSTNITGKSANRLVYNAIRGNASLDSLSKSLRDIGIKNSRQTVAAHIARQYSGATFDKYLRTQRGNSIVSQFRTYGSAVARYGYERVKITGVGYNAKGQEVHFSRWISPTEDVTYQDVIDSIQDDFSQGSETTDSLSRIEIIDFGL